MPYFEEGKDKLCSSTKLRKLIYCWLGEDLFFSFFGKQKDFPWYLKKFQAFVEVRNTEGCIFYFFICFSFPAWTTFTEFNNSHFKVPTFFYWGRLKILKRQTLGRPKAIYHEAGLKFTLPWLHARMLTSISPIAVLSPSFVQCMSWIFLMILTLCHSQHFIFSRCFKRY